MVGIVSYGSYVPWHRLGTGSSGWKSPREKAVANFDEDSITMAVAAAANCLGTIPRETIDSLYFATTTPPYRERSNATLVAVAADLASDIFVNDSANSLRAGTSSLKSAIDAVKSGSSKQALVVASDLRVPQARSEFETVFGDGASAILIGESNVIAEFEDSYFTSHEILDVWKADEDQFVRTWEDRFVAEQGYLKIVPDAVSKLLKKHNLQAKDFAKVALYGPDVRRHQEMVKKLGFSEKQIDSFLFSSVGNCGAAFALMMLQAALEDANPGDRILLVNYSNGADAMMFRVTANIEAGRKNKCTLKDFVNSKKLLPDYETYLVWRGLLRVAPSARRPAFRTPSPSAMAREVSKNLRFHGVRCKSCGYPQYPPQAICTKCHTKGNFEDYRFSDKRANIYTYTMDYLAPSLDPPLVLAAINFEAGGRAFSLLTDRDTKKIEIGLPVEMTFRRFYTSEGIHNYLWKCMPVR